MRHVSFCRSYRCRGAFRRLQCEPLEDRRLLAITVDTLIDQLDGSIVDGDVSLRDAIALAAAGETIDFDASLDGGTILLTMHELSITKAMTIDASSLDNGLTIDASWKSRIFNIDDGNDGADSPVTIRGLTVTGGNANGDRGAIHTVEDLTVTSSTISGNGGGGIWASGNVTVTSSTISGNGGGGIWASGDVTVTSSTISRNRSTSYGGNGGGIWASGEVTVTSSTISRNGVGMFAEGGGIWASGNVTITSSTISGNSAGEGGGGIWASDNVTITSSTISGNRASGPFGDGGGISVSGEVTVSIENSIVAGNTTVGTAADILWGTGTLAVRYSLIGDNQGTSLAEAPVGMSDANGNLIGDQSGMGIIDPLLGPLADNGGPTQTHPLLSGSPAIDAGDPSFSPPPEFEQRGNPRVAGGDADGARRIDMGAFELLRGDVNGDGYVNGLDVDRFVDVLRNGPHGAAADMNQDGAVNGLDVDPFVAAVVGADGQPGATLDAASASPTVEHVGNRAPELHRHVRDLHQGKHHPSLTHHRVVEQVSRRRPRLGGDRQAVSTGKVIQRMHQQHALASDWQATVDRAFGEGADWIDESVRQWTRVVP